MKGPIKNISASVRARLLNLARSTGRDFQELAIRYTVERFLARLVASEHCERFILKGAMLYIPWRLDDKRTTMDLDMLGLGNPTLDDLIRIFRQVCAITGMEDDGLEFDEQSLEASRIREESIYDGVRVVIRVHLGVMPIRLQVDVGFGDIVVPEPLPSEFPALLAKHGPMVRAYSAESVIAEKFNAMVVLGMANSRMKDYFDIWLLSRSFRFEGAILRESILQTFTRRQTALPVGEPIGLRAEFSSNESKRMQWQGFVKRLKRKETSVDFRDVVDSVRAFLMPVVASMTQSKPAPGIWTPLRGWDNT